MSRAHDRLVGPTSTMDTLGMDTTPLYHEVAGHGKPVVLLHPGFADSRIWEPQGGTYAEQFQVIRCDMRGFGRSQVRSLAVTHALDVAALLNQLEIRKLQSWAARWADAWR